MGGRRVDASAASCGVPFIEAAAVSIVTEVGRYLADLTRDERGFGSSRSGTGTVARLRAETEEDLLGSYEMSTERWAKLRSTNPLERLTRRQPAAPTWSGSTSPTKR
jgi:hypothetical protein